MSYTIKLKGRTDTINVGDKEGEVIAEAHARYNTSKQDTFLRFTFGQFNASAINSIDIHRSEVVKDDAREKDLQELSREEAKVLQLPPQDRARHFARRYYRFFFHARTGKQVTEQDMEKATEFLSPWFESNPKRLIPDPQVMFEIAPIGKPSVLHNGLYGFFFNALDRDYKQVAWRK